MLLTPKRKKSSGSRSFSEIIGLIDSSPASATASGMPVSYSNSLQQATVWACVRIVSEIIAQLPIIVQTKTAGGWEDSEAHDIHRLLAEPNDWQTQHDLIATLISWTERAGNGYLYKIYAGTGSSRRVAQLLPLESTDVSVSMDSRRKLSYTVGSETMGISGTFGADRIFHMRNFGSDGYEGLSTIQNHRNGIGLAMSLEEHASKNYANGLQGNKWVELDASTNEDEAQEMRKQLKKYEGTRNAGLIPTMQGAKFHEFSGVSAVDAQYIQSRKMQKEEIASIYMIPLFLLNSTDNTTWGSGLEQISRSFVRFSLNPRLNRLGQTIIREFLPKEARDKTRILFDTDQFTMGEFKDRMDGYRAATESGVLSPDECREMEGRQARAGGNSYRIPSNIQIEGENNDS